MPGPGHKLAQELYVRNGITETRGRLKRLNSVILVAFALISVAIVYWAIVRGPAILGRGDNPRLIEAELKIQRGAILDAENEILAITSGQDEALERRYPLPAAAPVVGYYSIRHGTAGIEEAFDGSLRGDSDDLWANFWRQDILGEAQVGRDVRLTLDSRWQNEAESLLGDKTGAALLFSIPDVAIRAMASTPGYDPNQLDADFERLLADEQAPLLNRVTQGQYQPGLLLQPFLLAIAQRDGVIDLDETPEEPNSAVNVEGVTLNCQAELAQPATWVEVMRSRCPGPMLEPAGDMGSDGLLQALDEFGLLNAPDLEIATEGNEAPAIADLALAAIGQDAVAVSPLQMGLALATLANEGQMRPAQLVLAVQGPDGQWQSISPEDRSVQVVPADVADYVLELFNENEGISEHGVVVLSGPEGESNSWYLGLAPAANPRYGVVVVVEDDDQLSSSQTIGRALLKRVLDPA